MGAERSRPAIALVGPRTDSRGGVASTIRALERSQLASEFSLIPVVTHRDGTAAGKLYQAVHGLSRLAVLCLVGRIDLVHLHVSSGASLTRKLIGLAIARATGVPVVLQVHGGGAYQSPDERRSALTRLERQAARVALESSDAVVALTESWERRLATQARLRRSFVVPNMPDVERDAAPRAHTRTPFLLFLGHLYRDKGVYELLHAFAELRTSHRDLRLVLAGTGAEAAGLRREARRLGIDDAVELAGWVDSQAKAELLSGTSCFVLPSYHEGLPLALLEAMLTGTPIVACAVGGVPDVVEDGREALLVAPKDTEALRRAIARVLDDPGLAKRLGDAAEIRAADEYTAAAVSERLRAVYRAVLAERSPRSLHRRTRARLSLRFAPRRRTRRKQG